MQLNLQLNLQHDLKHDLQLYMQLKKNTRIGGGFALLPQVSTQPIKKKAWQKRRVASLPLQKAAGPQRSGFLMAGGGMAVSLELRSHTSRPASDAKARAPLGKVPAWAVPVSAAPA